MFHQLGYSSKLSHYQVPKPNIDPWVTLAETLRQGPSLPRVQLMKFCGDPAEYAEFMTNFCDNIQAKYKIVLRG
jgi:hypothetical protein